MILRKTRQVCKDVCSLCHGTRTGDRGEPSLCNFRKNEKPMPSWNRKAHPVQYEGWDQNSVLGYERGEPTLANEQRLKKETRSEGQSKSHTLLNM